jgi:hypothetical protein
MTLGIYTDATTRSPDAPDGLAYGLALFFMLNCIEMPVVALWLA